jgi:hypothetical protein
MRPPYNERPAPLTGSRPPEDCHAGRTDTSIISTTQVLTQARLRAERSFAKIWRSPPVVVRLPRRLVDNCRRSKRPGGFLFLEVPALKP